MLTVGSWAILCGSETMGTCACGRELLLDSFRDIRSFQEGRIAGKCQSCQDDFFLGTSDRDELLGWRFRLRHGLIAGHRCCGSALDELALVPFIFTAPSREVAWETRLVVHAGEGVGVEELCYWDELGAARPVLDGHQVLVACAASLDAPEVASLVAGAELVVAAPCVLEHLARVGPGLAEGAEGVDAYAAAGVGRRGAAALEGAVRLAALDEDWPGSAGCGAVPSALRVCAWLVRLLAGRRLDRVLAERYCIRGNPLDRGVAS